MGGSASENLGEGVMLPDGIGVICTGGTFDKVYDPIKEKLLVSRPPASERILSKAQVKVGSISSILAKDSLELLPCDIDLISQSITESDYARLIVVHGTSRMVEVARSIEPEKKKTVLFTGAMVPNSIDSSETSFNLGFALSAAMLLPIGVWIAMGGKLFRSNQVEKDTNTGHFEVI
ncbi:MAG: asparaginase domain-containing protein [Pseudomonadota bacterium]